MRHLLRPGSGLNHGGIAPDTKDWTWVLSRACPDCEFDASTVPADQVGARIRRDAVAWVMRLLAPHVATRRSPGVWSVLEYGCHVRDVHRIFTQRVTLMLDQDAPHFPNWDQDATALNDDYASQDPDVVAMEVFDAAAEVADTYDRVPAQSWERRGLRSNGSEFTIETIALYHLHDIVHHAWDVTSPTSRPE